MEGHLNYTYGPFNGEDHLKRAQFCLYSSMILLNKSSSNFYSKKPIKYQSYKI